MTNAPIILERVLPASLEIVWKALTNVDSMKQWDFDLPEFKSAFGFEFNFTTGAREAKQYLQL